MKSSKHYKQGIYKPLFPEKWKGNLGNIVYRSGLELKFFRALENNRNVLQIASEEVVVPYISPIDNRKHRYFLDLWIRLKDSSGTIRTYLVEIKPESQTKQPKKSKVINESYINKVNTFLVNQAKWDAAKQYCVERGWDFVILTEKDLK
jgi:hypothetical protein